MGNGSGIDERVFAAAGSCWVVGSCGGADRAVDGAEFICFVGSEPGTDLFFGVGGTGRLFDIANRFAI